METRPTRVSALKAANVVKTKDNLRRCIEALTCLKALSLSSKDLRESTSLQKLERLRDHPNPKIQTEVRDLFSSLMRTLCAKPPPTPNSPQVSQGPNMVSSDDRSRERCDTSKRNETQLLEMFQAEKEAADAANTKGILLCQSDSSRCVDFLSKLKTIPVTWEVIEAHGMERRLEHLTKHKVKDLLFCHYPSLQHWRQSSGRQERRGSASKMNFNTPNFIEGQERRGSASKMNFNTPNFIEVV